MTIELMMLGGLIAGLVVSYFSPALRIGCISLLLVPIGMFFYIGWWQGQNPDKLRSTSGLDFLFGPLWPSLGALVGFAIGLMLKSWIEEKRNE